MRRQLKVEIQLLVKPILKCLARVKVFNIVTPFLEKRLSLSSRFNCNEAS
jgi:hypothetical protein